MSKCFTIKVKHDAIVVFPGDRMLHFSQSMGDSALFVPVQMDPPGLGKMGSSTPAPNLSYFSVSVEGVSLRLSMFRVGEHPGKQSVPMAANASCDIHLANAVDGSACKRG